MAYSEQVVRAAREKLEKRRRDAENEAAALRDGLCQRFPRLKEIEREKAAAIPELGDTIGFQQHNPHHVHDVFGHTARVV